MSTKPPSDNSSVTEAGRSATPGALLRRLAVHDERWLASDFEGWTNAGLPDSQAQPPALERRTRRLIELAALLAVGAPTTCLRWATERAAAAGADDESLVHVLQAAARELGTAQAMASAPRLALALELDLGGSDRA